MRGKNLRCGENIPKADAAVTGQGASPKPEHGLRIRKLECQHIGGDLEISIFLLEAAGYARLRRIHLEDFWNNVTTLKVESVGMQDCPCDVEKGNGRSIRNAVCRS